MKEDYNRDFSDVFEKGKQIKLSIKHYECPICKKKRGRGRVYDGGREAIYCPDCKTETPV